jgi:hypothetical protein
MRYDRLQHRDSARCTGRTARSTVVSVPALLGPGVAYNTIPKEVRSPITLPREKGLRSLARTAENDAGSAVRYMPRTDKHEGRQPAGPGWLRACRGRETRPEPLDERLHGSGVLCV